MNKSKVIISSTLDPRHLVCDLLDVDKMTLVWAFFHTLKITWRNKPKILQCRVSAEKTIKVATRNMFQERKTNCKEIVGPYISSKEFLFSKVLVNPKYSLVLGTMLYFWFFNFPIWILKVKSWPGIYFHVCLRKLKQSKLLHFWYKTLKSFRNDTFDLILAALSNTLRCSILLYEHNKESDNYAIMKNAHCIHSVRVSGTTPLFEKLLQRSNQYYDALVQNFSNGKSKCKYFFPLQSHSILVTWYST